VIPSRLTVSVSTRYCGCAYRPTSHDDSADASTELDRIVAIVWSMTPYAACAAVSSASAVPATVPPAVNVTLTVFFISSVPHTTLMSLYGMPVGPNVTPVVNACSSARSRNVRLLAGR
jgi:hypothetical protein